VESTITATDLARNLSDILNRVRYRHERFIVQRNGEAVAEINPIEGVKVFTVEDFRREFANLMVPEGLGAAIEEGRKALLPIAEDPWRSS
jgi:prevent-host-death family protein